MCVCVCVCVLLPGATHLPCESDCAGGDGIAGELVDEGGEVAPRPEARLDIAQVAIQRVRRDPVVGWQEDASHYLGRQAAHVRQVEKQAELPRSPGPPLTTSPPAALPSEN